MLYEVLRTAKMGAGKAPDLYTALLAKNLRRDGEVKTLSGIPPLTFQSNGQPLLDYLISGNTVQSGTPTPDSPVMPQGTGERTENLLDADIYYGTYKQSDGAYQTTRANLYNVQIKPFTADDIGKTFTFVADISPITGNARLCAIINGTIVSGSNTEKSVVTFTVETADDSIFFNYGSGSTTVTTLSDIMLVQGSTAPTSYIPWGYKIPISSANTTTPVYLGEVQTTRKIRKLVLDGTENWTYSSTYTRFMINLQNVMFSGIRLTPIICTHYITIDDGRSIDDVPNNAIYMGGSADLTQLFIKTDDYTTAADFKTYLQQQYAAGTPVCVWYVLATETTGIVNEPLMRIGDYADTLSMEQAGAQIPTAKGSTTLDVETTVKPSEVYIKYKS